MELKFDGIQVLPIEKRERYQTCLDQLDFTGAEKLTVNITRGKYMALKQKDLIEPTIFPIPMPKGDREKIIEHKIYIVYCRYHEELGLTEEEIPRRVAMY